MCCLFVVQSTIVDHRYFDLLVASDRRQSTQTHTDGGTAVVVFCACWWNFLPANERPHWNYSSCKSYERRKRELTVNNRCFSLSANKAQVFGMFRDFCQLTFVNDFSLNEAQFHNLWSDLQLSSIMLKWKSFVSRKIPARSRWFGPICNREIPGEVLDGCLGSEVRLGMALKPWPCLGRNLWFSNPV